LLSNAHLLVEDEALIKVAILQRATGFLDHLDHLKVAAAFEAEDSVKRKASEVRLITTKELARQGGLCKLEEILLELRKIIFM
jgi:hypothetical protein